MDDQDALNESAEVNNPQPVESPVDGPSLTPKPHIIGDVIDGLPSDPVESAIVPLKDVPPGMEAILKAASEAALKPPCGSIYIHSDGKSMDVTLNTHANYYGEWIKGEGGDICLYRDQETKKVVGAHLPFYLDEIIVGAEDGIKLTVPRYDDKLSALRDWLNAEIAAKPMQPYMAQKTLKKMKELGLIYAEG